MCGIFRAKDRADPGILGIPEESRGSPETSTLSRGQTGLACDSQPTMILAFVARLLLLRGPGAAVTRRVTLDSEICAQKPPRDRFSIPRVNARK